MDISSYFLCSFQTTQCKVDKIASKGLLDTLRMNGQRKLHPNQKKNEKL